MSELNVMRHNADGSISKSKIESDMKLTPGPKDTNWVIDWLNEGKQLLGHSNLANYQKEISTLREKAQEFLKKYNHEFKFRESCLSNPDMCAVLCGMKHFYIYPTGKNWESAYSAFDNPYKIAVYMEDHIDDIKALYMSLTKEEVLELQKKFKNNYLNEQEKIKKDRQINHEISQMINDTSKTNNTARSLQKAVRQDSVDYDKELEHARNDALVGTSELDRFLH